ncbi:unnamed protein product [Rotaria sp. Silwood2]|nr:unnamed protein product [Rotaria sp. Silwood2]
MSDSLLSSDKDDISSINTSSNPIHSSNERTKQEEEKHEEQINNLSELSLTENDSFFTILKRLCFYWRRIVAHKIRVIFTLIFMSMLNITARITCFARQRTPPSSSSFTTTLSSSSIRPLEVSGWCFENEAQKKKISYLEDVLISIFKNSMKSNI